MMRHLHKISVLWMIGLMFVMDGELFAAQYRAAIMNFTSDDNYYRSTLSAGDYTTAVQSTLASMPNIGWVERTELNAAISELNLSALSFSNDTAMLRIGKWVKADLLVLGRFVRTNSNSRTLILDVVFTDRAEILARRVQTISGDIREPVAPQPKDLETTATLIQQLLLDAQKEISRQDGKILLAPLFFRNLSETSRLDYLEKDLLNTFQKKSQSTPAIHILQFLRPRETASETELAFLGLVDQDKNACQRVADVYVWGSYKEEKAPGATFEQVPVTISISAFDGSNEMIELSEKTFVAQLHETAEILVSQLLQKITSKRNHQPGDHRQAIASILKNRAEEIQRMLWPEIIPVNFPMSSNGGKDAEFLQSIAGRSLRQYCVKVLELARFFDPSNAEIYKQLILSRWKPANIQSMNRSNFDIQYQRACDFDHYLTMFGVPLNGTKFDNIFLEYDFQSLLAVLRTIHAKGQRIEGFPIDVPDAVVLQWQTLFANQYINAVNLMGRSIDAGRGISSSDLFERWLVFGLDGIDDPRLKVKLIEAIWPYYRQTANFATASNNERSIEDRIIDAYMQIGQMERARNLLQKGKSKNLNLPTKPAVASRHKPINAAEQALRWERRILLMAQREAATQQTFDKRSKIENTKPMPTWVADIAEVRPVMFPFVLTDPMLMFERIGRSNFNGYFEPDHPRYVVRQMLYNSDRLWFLAEPLPSTFQPNKPVSSSFYGYAPSSDVRLVMDEKIGKQTGINDLLAFQDKIWMAMAYDGVWSFDSKTLAVRRYTGKDGVLTDRMLSMAAIGSHIYFAGRDKNNVLKLSSLDTETDRWSEVPLKNDKGTSPVDLASFPTKIRLVSWNRWLFLGGGTKCLLIDTKDFVAYDLSAQLGISVPENSLTKQNTFLRYISLHSDRPVRFEGIRKVAADRDGFWFAGSNHLFHFNPDTQSLEKIAIQGISIESLATQGDVLWIAASIPSAELRRRFSPNNVEPFPDDGTRCYLLAWQTKQHKWLGKMETPFPAVDIATGESCLWLSGQYVDYPIVEISTRAFSANQTHSPEWITQRLKEKSNSNQRDSFESTPLMLAAETGNMEIVHRLVGAGADVNAVTSQGFSPLMIASRRGHLDVVKFLIEHGATVQSAKRYKFKGSMSPSLVLTSPLLQACQAGQTKVVEYLLDNKANFDEEDFIGCTPLILAVQSGNVSTVKLLLSRLADAESADGRRQTALWWAAYYGYDDIVESLIRSGVRVDAVDADNLTPLHIAVERAKSSTAKLLLKNGADPFFSSKYHFSVLTKAIVLDNFEIFKACLDSSSHKPPSETILINALNIAINRNRKECFDVLISRISNVNQLDSNGYSPLERALRQQNPTFLQSLFDHGLDLNTRIGQTTLGEKALLVVVNDNYPRAVETLLARNVNPNICDSEGRPVLCLAARRNVKIFELLLRSGADLRTTDKDGKTVFEYAKDKPDILAVLKGQSTPSSASGPTISMTKADLSLAKLDLIGACRKGSVDETRSLLAQGADPNVKNTSGWPVLVLAAAKGQTEIVRVLLENHADANATGVGNWTALMQAAGHDHTAVVQLLIDHGANMLQENDWNKTAFDIAEERNCRAALKIFEQAGIAKSDGRLLIAATILSSPETMIYLLENGANVNGIDGQGRSALFEAADQYIEPGNDLTAMRILIKYGADVNLRDNRGFTPIFGAFRNSQALKIVSFLLDHGADLDIAVSPGDTPRQRMESFPNPQSRQAFMELLKQKNRQKSAPTQ
jgi:ankyrin repeat protein